jgi:hypothetical protein
MTQSHGSKAELSHDRQAADNSKIPERGRHRVRHLKSAGTLLIRIDQPTETQNQGNLMTQSHGSTVTIIILVTMIARLPKSKK